MGWDKYCDTKKKCPKCGNNLIVMAGSWSEQAPDAFKLFCSKCHYEKEITDDEAYQLEKEYTKDEYPKEIVFIVKTLDDEKDLFELLYKHNIKYNAVIQKSDTYELDFSEAVR